MSNAPHFVHPEGWAPARGYANAMLAPAGGRLLTIAGQIGWHPGSCTFESDDFAEQTRQALENIACLLRDAGGSAEHLVRLTWFITDLDAYMAARRPIGQAWRALFGTHYPPMSVVVVSGLVEPRARVEIEVTAVLPA